MIRMLGGARLAKDGIHLGHYVGNFLPIFDFDSPKQYVFVIKDTEPIIWPSNELKKNTFLDMISDVLSLPFSDSILVTTSSVVLRNSYLLQAVVQDIVSFNTLITTHFKKHELRNQVTSTSLKNFLFPVDEAVTLLALKSNYFISNDDNLRMVRFGRDIARKINGLIKIDFFPLPQLKHHNLVPRLIGRNYKRMCKANNNTIRISDEPKILYEKIVQLASWKAYFSQNQIALNEYNLDKSNFVFREDYLPFIYWRIFSNNELKVEDMAFYSKMENRDKLCKDLFEIIDNKLQSIRLDKVRLMNNQSVLWNRVKRDSEIVQQIINVNLKDFESLIL